MSEVIDNFLDNETSNEIEKQLLSANFPWYYCENSTTYTNEHKRLLKDKNLSKEKVLEEINELIESVDKNSNKIHEAADVFYHLIIYLESNDIKIEDIMSELKSRKK